MKKTIKPKSVLVPVRTSAEHLATLDKLATAKGMKRPQVFRTAMLEMAERELPKGK